MIAAQWFSVKAAFIGGIALGAVYGLVSVSLVFTYRVSRVVAFVHGGIALASASLYWYLTADPARTSGANSGKWAYATREWPKWPALLLAVALGAVIAAVFGAISTGRMATWPRFTVTTFSIGGMLLITGITVTIWKGALEIVNSPFGEGRRNILGYVLSDHQIAVIILLPIIVTLLHLLVTRTRFGIAVRSLSDDIEAAELVGMPVQRVAVGVWVVSGALAAFSGVMLVVNTRVGADPVIFVLLRSMAGAALGGFTSLPLALIGAIVFGQIETHVTSGTFGEISSGWREIILMTVLSVSMVFVAWVRSKRSRSRAV